MSKPLTVPISLDLGINGGKVEFTEVDQYASFIADELAFWSFLPDVAPPGSGTLSDLARSPLTTLEGIQTAINQFNAGTSDSSAFERYLTRAYISGGKRILHRTHPDAQFIRSLAGKLPNTAFWVATVYLLGRAPGNAFDITNLDQMIGLSAAVNHRLGLNIESGSAAAQSMELIRADFQKKFSEQVQQAVAQRGELVAHLQTFRDEAAQALQQKDTDFSTFKGEKDAAINTSLGELENVRKSYQEQMKLEAPTEYWEEKRTGHRARAVWYGRVCLVYALLAAVLGFWGLGETYSYMQQLKPETHFSLYVLLAAKGLVIFIIAFWVARILVRRYLSELHLATDAQERKTMVMTYLALTQAGKINETERPLVLQPLFRSTSDGIVKDDGSADPLISALLARGLSVRI